MKKKDDEKYHEIFCVVCGISHQYLLQLFSNRSLKLQVTTTELNRETLHLLSIVKLTILVTVSKVDQFWEKNYFSSL